MAVGAQNVESLISLIVRLINMITPVIFTLALIFFVWAVIGLIRADEKEREDKKKQMGWGIIAMFVIFSIWGITKFIGRNIGVGQDSSINHPRGFTN